MFAILCRIKLGPSRVLVVIGFGSSLAPPGYKIHNRLLGGFIDVISNKWPKEACEIVSQS